MNVPASVVQAAPAVTPAFAEQQGIQGPVQVVVSLDTASHVVGARIQSSPSAVLNQAALSAARQTTFQTEIRECRPLAADFIFTVDFIKKVTFSTATSGERTVSVVGQGTVTRAADAALVQADITFQDDTAAGATAKDDAAFGALLAKLTALGINENGVRSTSTLYVRRSPRPDASMPSPARPGPTSEGGYMRSRHIEITVDTVANAGHVAFAAASLASADPVAIRYALNAREPAYREALNIALKDAENGAREAVTSQQLHLGVLRQVVVPPNDRARAPVTLVRFHLIPVVGGFKEPDIRVPELEVHAAATVTYAVKP
ncbi:MAG TPA: SIMPL domain-containing protein [Xanthomonadales bacterium]|nr:SIMPL domain-containing protein [Xanthomonadales bacterium]